MANGYRITCELSSEILLTGDGGAAELAAVVAFRTLKVSDVHGEPFHARGGGTGSEWHSRTYCGSHLYGVLESPVSICIPLGQD
jgi:hypothetical protein